MNKKIAPIVIVALLSFYLIGYLGVIFLGILSKAPIMVTVLLTVLAVAIAGALIALIYTLVTRLREIDKEDDDDLSNY